MADFILKNWSKVYSPLHSLAEKIYKKFQGKEELKIIEKLRKNNEISFELPSREDCPICEKSVKFSSLTKATCDAGHTLGN